MPSRPPTQAIAHSPSAFVPQGFLSSPLGLRIEGHSTDTPSAFALKGSTHPLGLSAEGFDSPSSHLLGGGSSPNLRSSRIPKAYGRPPWPESSRANHIDRRPQGSLRDVPGCSEAPLPGSVTQVDPPGVGGAQAARRKRHGVRFPGAHPGPRRAMIAVFPAIAQAIRR